MKSSALTAAAANRLIRRYQTLLLSFRFRLDLYSAASPDPSATEAGLFSVSLITQQKQAVREAATICPVPCKLTFVLLTLKVVSESRPRCANFSLPRPLCSRLMPDVRDRQTSDTHHRLMPLPYGRGHNKRLNGAAENVCIRFYFSSSALTLMTG